MIRVAAAACMMWMAVSAPAGAVQSAATRPTPEQLRAVTPEAIMGLTDAGDPEISPDGRQILYVTQPGFTHRPSKTEIWIAATDGRSPPRKLTGHAGLEGNPQWSPDGASIAFVSNRPAQGAPKEAAARQLWLIPAAGGEAQPLTAISREIARFRWSPDGRSIAFLAPDAATEAEKADRAAKRDWVDVDAPRDLLRLWVLDLASRDLRRIALADRSISEMNWSPDGKRFAVRAAATTELNDHFYHSDLLVLDAATGGVRNRLFKGVYSAGSWSPDGTRLAFTAPEESPIGIRAFVVDIASGATTPIGAALDGTVRQLEWSLDNKTLLARAAIHTRDILFSVDARTGRFHQLVDFGGRISGFSMAENGTIALSGSQWNRAADIWIHRGGKLRLLTDLNPQMRGWKLGKVEQVRWTSSRDQRPVYGVLVTPPGQAAGVPGKTVVLAHGGPHENWNTGWQGSWIEWGQMLASHGYTVLLPNPRGSAGQGTAFARGVVGGWGTLDYQDVTDGVDMLVEKKIADPARLGIGGWSYGGFMSAWAITHDTRFKTAIVGAALTDQFSATLGMDTPDFVTAYFGLPPAGTAAMDASSPMRAVDRVQVPVLVLHGQEDRRVPIGQGLGFYRGLRLLGKEAQMIAYPREPHRIFEFEHQLDMQRRVLAWYDAHL